MKRITERNMLISLCLYILSIYICIYTQMYSMLSLSAVVELFMPVLCLCILLFTSNCKKIASIDIVWAFPIIVLFYNCIGSFSFDLVRDLIVWSVGVLLIIQMFERKVYDSFLNVLLFGGTIYAISLLFQYIFPNAYFSTIGKQFKGAYAETVSQLFRSSLKIPTGLAHQIGFSIGYVIVAIGLLFFVCKFQKKTIKYSIFVLFVIALLISKKRMHFVGSIFSLLFIFWYSASKGNRGRRFFLLLIIGMGVLVFAIMILEQFGINSVFDRLFLSIEQQNSGESIAKSREVLAQEAIQIWLSSPLLGIGWRQFAKQGYAYTTVHNVFLQLLCETGIVGITFILLPIMITAYKTIQLLNVYRDNPSENINWLLFSSYYQLFFIMYFFTGNPLYDYVYLIPYFISVSVIKTYSKNVNEKKNKSICKYVKC